MKGFVVHPNLPSNTESLLICEKYAKILQNPIEKAGISVVIVPNNSAVDARLSGHVDLSICHAGGERLFATASLKNTELTEQLGVSGAKITYLGNRRSARYPNDVPLNAVVIGKYLIANPKTCASEIVDYLTIKRRCILLPVKQGYTRCSVCPVGEGALITSDLGIARAAVGSDLDVLLISPGAIDLPGFAYGFIGGAAFKISDDKLAFTGMLSYHPDEKRILDFLEKHGVEPVYLTKQPLFDIGGAIPLTEKDRLDP